MPILLKSKSAQHSVVRNSCRVLARGILVAGSPQKGVASIFEIDAIKRLSFVEGRPGHLRGIAAPHKRGRGARTPRHQWIDHRDRKPRYSTELRQRRVSTALLEGELMCLPFAVYSPCVPVFFGKEDVLVRRWCSGRVGFCGTLRRQAFFSLQVFSAPGQCSRLPLGVYTECQRIN